MFFPVLGESSAQLTRSVINDYLLHVAAKSVTGRRNPNTQGAQRRQGVFLCLSSMAGRAWEASCLPVSFVSGIPTPRTVRLHP